MNLREIMWKVNNEENKKYLDDFRKQLIEPMFKEIINYKKLNLQCEYIKYIKDNKLTICKLNNKLISYLNNRSFKNVKFGDLIQEFIKLNTVDKVEYYYHLYKEQNDKVDSRDYNIQAIEIDNNLKDIFVNFFYEKFFNSEAIWERIDFNKYNKDSYTRKKFHSNFKKENSLYICPYCDIDTTINISNNEIEHFLPKAKYPLLSMNPYNLIPSCVACNKPSQGKGTKIYIPIESPYNKQIGNEIQYKNDVVNKQIILKSKDIKIANYLETLNLIERYKDNNIYELVEEKAQEIYDTIIEAELNGEEIGEVELKKYMIEKRKISKTEVLSFAVNGTFCGLDLYKKYKTSLQK